MEAISSFVKYRIQKGAENNSCGTQNHQRRQFILMFVQNSFQTFSFLVSAINFPTKLPFLFTIVFFSLLVVKTVPFALHITQHFVCILSPVDKETCVRFSQTAWIQTLHNKGTGEFHISSGTKRYSPAIPESTVMLYFRVVVLGEIFLCGKRISASLVLGRHELLNICPIPSHLFLRATVRTTAVFCCEKYLFTLQHTV